MGNERYPYKGILDVIANRCLASGTNAWTDQDHTAYTLSTVGSTGFLKVLPVYMDHVLSPSLTKEQFITEVHHINGNGEDAGVVYSEMQDHESDMENIVSRKRKELFYPEGSPYRVETGGRLPNLRTSCCNEKIREFHSQFYHLNNMMLVVCGIIDHEKLLNIVSGVEEGLLSRIPSLFHTPFREEVPPIEKYREAVIDCPSDDEHRGIVSISWIGPTAADLYTIAALEVLFDYMQNTAVAPLQKDFIQLTNPFASSVCFSISEQSTSEIILSFSGVPIDKLFDIKKRLFEKTIVEHSNPKKFDMERLGFVINQSILKAYAKMETAGHDKIFEMMIGHQIYGTDEGQLAERLNEIDTLHKLQNESASFWSNLISSYLNDRYVCVIGKPSREKVNEYAIAEEKRLEKQREDLGEAGLAECEERLQKAIEKNTALKPSPEVLADLIVNELEKFNTFEIATKCNMKRHYTSVPLIEKIPFTTFLHRAPTKFIELSIIWDTEKIPLSKRIWLMLWFELMFESPAKVGDEVLPYEEVAKLFTRDLISQSVEVGVSCYYSRYITLKMKVSSENYTMLQKWAAIFLGGVVFEGSRVVVSAQKLASQAVEAKRDGSTVCATLFACTVYKPGTNSYIYGTIQLEKFHEEVAKKATINPKWVVNQLEQLRSCMLSMPVNIHIACNDSLIEEQIETDQWGFLNGNSGDHKRGIFIGEAGDELDEKGFGQQRAVSVGATESSFLYQRCYFDQDWRGEDLMATMLLSQYLTQCEGPLWRGIRGEGLAYGANIYVQPDKKLLTLSLYRGSQINQAYEETKKIVLSVLDDGNVDRDDFEAAKRSLVCEIMEAEDTVKRAATQAVLAHFRQIPPNFTRLDFYLRELCARIWDASVDEVLKVGAPHLKDLFDESKCTRAVVVHPSKVKEIQEHFPGIECVPIENLAISFES
uniref:Peptidase_M16_C domain-containing protein n=1 Tax=Ascaris lumbricoides TaxID=6252 RepID=A0A0M3IJ63_ASCLU